MSIQIYHKHHIIPRHAGGIDHPSNIELLSIQDHAAIHYERWVYIGDIEDYWAWIGLTKMFSHQELIQQIQSYNGKKNKGKIHSEQTKQLWSQQRKGNTYRKGKKLSDQQKQQISDTLTQHYQIINHHRKGKNPWNKNLTKHDDIRVQNYGNKISQIKKGKIPNIPKEKISNPKKYQVVSPEGIFEKIINLYKFCQEKKLTQSLMLAVAKGKQTHHKGWKCSGPMN